MEGEEKQGQGVEVNASGEKYCSSELEINAWLRQNPQASYIRKGKNKED